MNAERAAHAMNVDSLNPNPSTPHAVMHVSDSRPSKVTSEHLASHYNTSNIRIFVLTCIIPDLFYGVTHIPAADISYYIFSYVQRAQTRHDVTHVRVLTHGPPAPLRCQRSCETHESRARLCVWATHATFSQPVNHTRKPVYSHGIPSRSCARKVLKRMRVWTCAARQEEPWKEQAAALA